MTSKTLPKKQMHFTNRKLDDGMGTAVARRTYLRKIIDSKTGRERWEKWSEVADRVALGNTLLLNNIKGTGLLKGLPSRVQANKKHQEEEYKILRKHIANASLLMSGRHLQHGDETQPGRNMEVFTNCASASSSYILFYLLMNGSGVGRAYDDDMCVVDWDNMPSVRCVISEEHPDFVWGFDESVLDAKHKYGKGDNIHWFEVPDDREGWAQAVELMETMAFEKKFKNELLILDFSKVRAAGSLIKGMQNRPASGPKPLMNAIERVVTVKGAGMSLWKQALFIDHYLAECVLVGGARRSARTPQKIGPTQRFLNLLISKKVGFYGVPIILSRLMKNFGNRKIDTQKKF